MEIGVDSFAAMFSGNSSKVINDADALGQLLDRIENADHSGLDVFGIGEHHRKGFLDSAPTLILAAGAALVREDREPLPRLDRGSAPLRERTRLLRPRLRRAHRRHRTL